MIIIRLQGGLGNQLFQYALGRALSIKNNVPMKLDISQYYKKNEIRKYGLKDFNINAEIATKREITSIGIPDPQSNFLLTRITRKVFRYFDSKKKISERKYVLEPNFTFSEEILNIKDNAYINGDWQSFKYFENIKSALIQELYLAKPLSPEAEKIGNGISKTNSVSVHIRRGDYISNSQTNSFHGTCSTEYYRNAINRISKETTSPILFIFSDDINWVRENIKFQFPTIYVSKPEIRDYEELILMSKCKHNIIANSSFSWWGAWLNQNPNKIVVAPQKWFNASVDTSDLVPENWIRI